MLLLYGSHLIFVATKSWTGITRVIRWFSIELSVWTIGTQISFTSQAITCSERYANNSRDEYFPANDQGFYLPFLFALNVFFFLFYKSCAFAQLFMDIFFFLYFFIRLEYFGNEKSSGLSRDHRKKSEFSLCGPIARLLRLSHVYAEYRILKCACRKVGA